MGLPEKFKQIKFEATLPILSIDEKKKLAANLIEDKVDDLFSNLIYHRKGFRNASTEWEKKYHSGKYKEIKGKIFAYKQLMDGIK